uniref:WD_REPEATS_REGION domain-containing protein n=1 Tax=Macrostomum lignano TaxID=282301 RepID=A0A1I8HIH5_9PLAT
MDADLADGAPLGGAASSASRRRLVDAAGAGLVPTRLAEASRALAGNTSTVEQYAFAGFACVIDRHVGSNLKSSATCRGATRLRFANNDSERLAVGSMDGSVSVSLVSAGACQLVCQLPGHVGPIASLAWSTDNCLLLTASLDGAARVWQIGDDKNLIGENEDELKSKRLLRQFPVAEGDGVAEKLPAIYAAEFAPSNNNLVNLSTGLCQSSLRLSAPVTCLAFGCESVSDPGGQLWLGDSNGCLQRCRLDQASGQLTRIAAYSCCFGGDDLRAEFIMARSWLSREARDPCLLVCTSGSEILLYRLEVDQPSSDHRNSTADSARNQPSLPVLRCRLPVPKPTRAAFCPLMSFRQGACIVCASDDACVYICDVGRPIRPIVNKLQGHATGVTDVAFNYDESLLASADADGLVIVWRRA